MSEWHTMKAPIKILPVQVHISFECPAGKQMLHTVIDGMWWKNQEYLEKPA